ncbi:DUF4114 domain-containing protein [Pseudoduganella danionis]|nr:DUF4114 domain-containing protein [Pseudoduganella danionis]
MLFKKSLLLAALLGATLTAQANVAIVGSKIVVKDTGAVTATFLGSDAGYNDVVFFDNSGTQLFSGHHTANGTTIDLGTYNAGTILNFSIHVDNTGDNFYMGPASVNKDNVFHAAVTQTSNNTAVVGFEDLYGGGDRDYNDIQFKVTNVTAAVPEPESYAMMLGGLGLMGLLARRRKAK